jgi:hypothetical protein
MRKVDDIGRVSCSRSGSSGRHSAEGLPRRRRADPTVSTSNQLTIDNDNSIATIRSDKRVIHISSGRFWRLFRHDRVQPGNGLQAREPPFRIVTMWSSCSNGRAPPLPGQWSRHRVGFGTATRAIERQAAVASV